MSFLISQAREIRPAVAEILPDARKRLTRYLSWKQNSELPVELTYTYGDADTFSGAPSGWSGLRLTNVRSDPTLSPNNTGGDPVCVATYEQISNSTLTQVGGLEITELEDGRQAKTLTYIQFSSVAYTPVAAGYNDATYGYLMTDRSEDDGSIRRIKRTYVESGTISQSDETKNGGALLVRTIVKVGSTAPATPSGYTPIGEAVKNPDGLDTYTYTFAKGDGVVSTSIGTRTDGLRTVTSVSLGTKDTPSGIVIDDQEREADGHTVYTVTSIQGADGTTAVTSVSLSWQRYVPFTYPGRAKAFTETYDTTKTQLALYTSPPVSTLVKATITVSYTTTSTLGTISDFWNPTDWAAVRKQWVGAYGVAAATTEALPGYRSTSATAVTLAGSGYDATIEGHNIYAGTTARITCTGGPADPGGNTYTLAAELEPAFTSTAGTAYYRKTLVSATIPAQASLPV